MRWGFGLVIVQLFDNLRAYGLTLKEASSKLRKQLLITASQRTHLLEKKNWDDLAVKIDVAKVLN